MPDICESCGKEVEPYSSGKTLEEAFTSEERKKLAICMDCFGKRFKLAMRRQSGYGGTVYDLEERSAPRFGLGSTKFSCLKCSWVAWTEAGLRAHVNHRHAK